MGWEDHAQELLDTKHVHTAGIIGREDGTIYGVIDNAFSDAEAELISTFFKGEGKVPAVILNGVKFQLISFFEDEVAYLVNDKGGACVARSETTLVVGTWDKASKHTAGNCNKQVQKKAEELKDASM